MAQKRKRVLIADDDRILTQMLSSRLQTMGWAVDVALDAMQAVMFTRQNSPDILALGAVEFLHKPIEAELLDARLRAALGADA